MKAASQPLVYVVDDDPAVREAMCMLLESAGHRVSAYGSAEEFLRGFRPDSPCCLILDLQMPETGGLELQEELGARGHHPPVIFLTGHGSVPAAVRALKQGAMDFFQKPLADDSEFLAHVAEALRRSGERLAEETRRSGIRERISRLTGREREVMDEICSGKANKVVALDLGISERTVELHRSRLMHKLGVRSVAELVRIRDELEPG